MRVAEIVPETAEANSIRFEVPPELREAFAFKAGQRPGTIMDRIAKGYSEDEIRAIAAWYEAQK